jgi:MoxR-like ATPase
MIGRTQEMAAAHAVLAGGRHLLLEGPVGSGKTTLALAVCHALGRETVRLDGDDRCTEGRLAGWFDPPLVLARGYREEAFVPGPLVRAMREGRVLFLNELNRLPEAAQNLLLPALDEGLVQVPHLGQVDAAEGFQVVATQNPAEYVATGHLSEAIRDRFEHLDIGYQSAEEEEAIVAEVTGCRDGWLVRTAVRLARGTRLHPRVRRGASARGAIAIVELATGMGGEALRRAAEAALATRVELRDADGGFDAVLDELLELVVERGEDPDAAFAAGAFGGETGGAQARRRSAPHSDGPEEPRPPARAAEPEACTLGDRRALARQLRAAPEDLDGWKLAGDLSAGALDHAGERAWLCAQQLAAGAVLQRAGRLVGPLKAATRTVREPLLEPWSGELDVEATVENLLGKPHPEPGDLIVQRRVDRRHQVVLMVDTSLSMAGE